MIHPRRDGERGVTLVELMAALVVLALGVMALMQLFPTASRGQLQDRMLTTGNMYAQEKVEDLETTDWNSANLADGRHPGGSAFEDLGASQSWHRFYTVATMASPLDNLKKIVVTVNWTYLGQRSVTATTYVRR